MQMAIQRKRLMKRLKRLPDKAGIQYKKIIRILLVTAGYGVI
jgi:hypothetical protein